MTPMPKRTRLIEASLPCTFEQLSTALAQQAHRLAAAGGHHLGGWTHAKKKFGRGARLAFCLKCGDGALLLPGGDAYAAHGPHAHQMRLSPGMRGEALSRVCPADLGL